MSNENKLIPKLRFPEFANEGEWKEIELGNLIDIKGRIGYRGYTINDIVNKGEGAVSMSPSNIGEDGSLKLEKSTYISWEKYHESPEIILQNGFTVLVKTGSTYGKVAFINNQIEKSTINPQLVVLKPVNVNSFFLYLIVSNSSVQEQIEATVVGGAIPTLSQNSISKFNVLIPPDKDKKEQQKIAACLSSLDEVITAHSQKLEALKDHKKGLMQNLFPQEGERVPAYRFPDFREDGEWEEKKLEGLAKRGSGHTPNKKMSNYYNGGIKWVSLADSKKLDNGFINATKIQISQDGIENSSAVLHPAGTVILSRDAGVGKSAVLYSEMAVSQHFIVWVCDESKLTNWFLYYVLQVLKPVFESIAIGSTIKTIGLPYFKELSISVPSISEQQKIASCLSSLDELITAQTEEIAQLQLHKKGLMQGLFPNN
jgi:type I restriction enzyme S subunit